MKWIEQLRETIAGRYRNMVLGSVRHVMLPTIAVLEDRVRGLYAHLSSRGIEPCDAEGHGVQLDGTPVLPNTQNLLPTLHRLDSRKVECYETDGIEDGVSLARVLCDTTATANITELVDKEKGWTMDKALESLPNCEVLTIGCSTMGADSRGNAFLNFNAANTKIRELHLPNLTNYPQRYDWYQTYCFNLPNLEVFDAPSLISIGSGHSCSLIPSCKIEVLTLPKVERISNLFLSGNTTLKELVMPNCTYLATPVGLTSTYNCVLNCTALERVVFGKSPTIGNSTFKDARL